MTQYNTKPYYKSVKALERVSLIKVNNYGNSLGLSDVVKGTGVGISAQYNPTTIRYGKRMVSKENNAAGEHSPPVEILGGNANTLSFVLRLNSFGEPDAGTVDQNVFENDSKFTTSQGEALFEQEGGVKVITQLYEHLIFLDSLQYPNKGTIAGKYLKTPLVMIRLGSWHMPLVWIIDNISFDIKLFDPHLNIQRADVNVSFKLSNCYYNTEIFKDFIPTMFYNIQYNVQETAAWEAGVLERLKAGEKYESHAIADMEL